VAGQGEDPNLNSVQASRACAAAEWLLLLSTPHQLPPVLQQARLSNSFCSCLTCGCGVRSSVSCTSNCCLLVTAGCRPATAVQSDSKSTSSVRLHCCGHLRLRAGSNHIRLSITSSDTGPSSSFSREPCRAIVRRLLLRAAPAAPPVTTVTAAASRATVRCAQISRSTRYKLQAQPTARQHHLVQSSVGSQRTRLSNNDTCCG
jgi:hypothetical protein